MTKDFQALTYLTKELYDDFTALARLENAAVSEVVRRLIKRAVDENRESIKIFRELQRRQREQSA